LQRVRFQITYTEGTKAIFPTDVLAREAVADSFTNGPSMLSNSVVMVDDNYQVLEQFVCAATVEFCPKVAK